MPYYKRIVRGVFSMELNRGGKTAAKADSAARCQRLIVAFYCASKKRFVVPPGPTRALTDRAHLGQRPS